MALPDTVSPRRLTRVSTCFRQDTAGAFGKAILLFYSRHGPSVSIGFSAGSNVIPLDMLPHAEDANYFRPRSIQNRRTIQSSPLHHSAWYESCCMGESIE